MPQKKENYESSKRPNPQPISPDRDHSFVRCANFRCLAYRDRNGVWRAVFGNEELPEILEIYQ